MHMLELKANTLPELYKIAQELSIDNATGLRKQDLIFGILQAQIEREGIVFGEGVLDVLPDGRWGAGRDGELEDTLLLSLLPRALVAVSYRTTSASKLQEGRP